MTEEKWQHTNAIDCTCERNTAGEIVTLNENCAAYLREKK